MKYEELIETVSQIINNDKIYKKGLTLVYELDEDKHKKMDEHLFYKSNHNGVEFKHRDVVEVSIGGVLINFTKKSSKNL